MDGAGIVLWTKDNGHEYYQVGVLKKFEFEFKFFSPMTYHSAGVCECHSC
jgi:hypothetical protein